MRALSGGCLVDAGLELEQAGLRCEARVPLWVRVDAISLSPPRSHPTWIAGHGILTFLRRPLFRKDHDGV